MALKHQYGLSDRDLCRLVADRISWRRFCRIPWTEPVPHPSSLSKIRRRLDAGGGDHMALLNEHLVKKAGEKGLLKAQKLRVDTTVTEANVHHPTDASLVADGVRVVTRLIRQAQALGTAVGVKFRDRTRSIKKRLLRMAKVLRRRTGEAVVEVRKITAEIARIGSEALVAAEAVLQALQPSGDRTARRIRERLATMAERTGRVIRQARQVNAGQLSLPDRVVSVFDPDARPIRRGKLKADTEFGYKVRLAETKEQLITDCQVFVGNPADQTLLLGAVASHTRRTGRVPQAVASDRGFWDTKNERALKKLGVEKVSLPRRGKRSLKRTAHEREPWFRSLQRWRAGQESTISVLKRRYGLARTRYRRLEGCRRWVGGAVWGYNLDRIARLAG